MMIIGSPPERMFQSVWTPLPAANITNIVTKCALCWYFMYTSLQKPSSRVGNHWLLSFQCFDQQDFLLQSFTIQHT